MKKNKGASKNAYENEPKERGFFKQSTYTHVIFKRQLFAKHPKQIKLSFKDYTRKIVFSYIFIQTFDTF